MEVKKFHEDNEVYLCYKKEDILTIWELTNRFKNSKYFDSHNLWDIPYKTTEADVYEDGQLSE